MMTLSIVATLVKFVPGDTAITTLAAFNSATDSCGLGSYLRFASATIAIALTKGD
jgi:hypothetical protein